MLHIVTLSFWLLLAFCYYIWRMCFFYHRNSPSRSRRPPRTIIDNSDRIRDPESCSDCYTDTRYTFNRTQVWHILESSLILPGRASFKKFMCLTNGQFPEGLFTDLYNRKRWVFYLGFMFRILGIINDKNKLNSIYNLVSFLGHVVNIDINLRLPISFCFFSANVTFNLQDPSLQH